MRLTDRVSAANAATKYANAASDLLLLWPPRASPGSSGNGHRGSERAALRVGRVGIAGDGALRLDAGRAAQLEESFGLTVLTRARTVVKRIAGTE